MTSEQVQAVVRDYRNANLDPTEVAVCAFAEKITLNAYKVTSEDVDALRALGLSDPEVLDIAIAVGFRSMYSKVLDTVGAEPDAKYSQLDSDLLESLAIGRPFPHVSHEEPTS
jgi:alkylhydroperoxidase family enzyme